jgi:hypothetical protein
MPIKIYMIVGILAFLFFLYHVKNECKHACTIKENIMEKTSFKGYSYIFIIAILILLSNRFILNAFEEILHAFTYNRVQKDPNIPNDIDKIANSFRPVVLRNIEQKIGSNGIEYFDEVTAWLNSDKQTPFPVSGKLQKHEQEKIRILAYALHKNDEFIPNIMKRFTMIQEFLVANKDELIQFLPMINKELMNEFSNNSIVNLFYNSMRNAIGNHVEDLNTIRKYLKITQKIC